MYIRHSGHLKHYIHGRHVPHNLSFHPSIMEGFTVIPQCNRNNKSDCISGSYFSDPVTRGDTFYPAFYNNLIPVCSVNGPLSVFPSTVMVIFTTVIEKHAENKVFCICELIFTSLRHDMCYCSVRFLKKCKFMSIHQYLVIITSCSYISIP